MTNTMMEKFYRIPKDLARRKDLTPAAKLIFANLLDRLGLNDEVWPGYGTIADDLGLSRATAIAGVKNLVFSGLIDFVSKGGGRKSNRYKFLTGTENRPVNNFDGEQSKNESGGSQKIRPELTHRTNPLNNTQKKAVEIQIPSRLDEISGFREAWDRWVGYRRQIGQRLSPMTMESQLKKLAGMENPVAVIDQSITFGWHGLFELKDAKNGNRPTGRTFEAGNANTEKFANVGKVIRV